MTAEVMHASAREPGGEIAGWLAARTPAAPRMLIERVHALLGDAGSVPRDEIPEHFLGAAERELARLLRGDQRARECAVDLLAVDALVTYALEAAADDPARLAARAESAIAALSSLSLDPR